MNKSLLLPAPVYGYVLANTLREPPLLQRLREETAKLPRATMQITPDQGQLISLLVRLINARKALELGVFTGYSSLCIAMALPAEGSLLACDVSRKWTNVARRYWQQAGVEHKVQLRLAPALQTLQSLLQEGQTESFDFVFIDADKKNYRTYYELSLQLLRPGGIILIDNTLRAGTVADPAMQDEGTVTMRAFNAQLLHDERIELSLLPLGDGLTLALKRD